MESSTRFAGREGYLVSLFRAVFAASEGQDAGDLIGDLVRDQLATTPVGDLHVVFAEEGGALVAAAIATRLTYENDPRAVFVIGPVAVATDRQKQGLGQALLRQTLDILRAAGIDVATTYGDPAYYTRVGFEPMTEDFAPAPYPLQHPHGWLGLSLTDAPLTALAGPCGCVPAFADPVFW